MMMSLWWGVLNWHWFGWLQFHQYQVVGRGLPSETDEHPKIYRMKLWATNEVRAKSKFWWVVLSLCIILAIEIGIQVNEFDLILFFVVDPTRRGHFVYAWESYMVFTFWDAWNQMLVFHFLLSLCSEHITILNLICIIDLHFKRFDFSFIKSQKEYDSEGFPL